MSSTFVLTIVFLIAFIFLFIGARSSGAPVQRILKLSAYCSLGLALLCFALSTFTIVPTRDIGIVTSFGKPVGNLDNGIHAKLPWEKVKTLDGAIQTDSYLDKNVEGCTDIRIGNESTACVDNSIRWRIKLEAGEALYKDYRDMDNIRKSLVTRELTAALNEVLSDYNPLSQIQDDSANAAGPNLNEFSRQVADKLRAQVGDQIDVKNVIIPLIHFDKPTQSKINLYQAEVANTRIAQQREKTATAQSRANDRLKSSVSNNPNVLVSQCLDTFGEMVKEGQRIPIGFSCWPGGSSTSVVVPQQ
jgi:hypothetical protein